MGSWRSPETLVSGFHDELSVRRSSYRRVGQTDLFVSKPWELLSEEPMAQVSLGGAPFGGLYGPVRSEVAEAVVVEALRNGVNLIDAGFWWSQVRSEAVLGRALSRVPRRAFYLSTSVGRWEGDFGGGPWWRAEEIIRSVEESMRRLRVQYLDIVQLQLHDALFEERLGRVLEEALPALNCLRYAGKVRYIALAGYSLEKVCRVVELSRVEVDAVVSHSRATLADQSLALYLPYFKSRGLGVLSGSPTACGLLTMREVPEWHPAPSAVVEAASGARSVCREAGVSLPRLATAFALNFPGVESTFLGAHSLTVLHEHLQTSWFPLSPLEFATRKEIVRRFMKPLSNANWEGRLKPARKVKKAAAEAATGHPGPAPRKAPTFKQNTK